MNCYNIENPFLKNNPLYIISFNNFIINYFIIIGAFHQHEKPFDFLSKRGKKSVSLSEVYYKVSKFILINKQKPALIISQQIKLLNLIYYISYEKNILILLTNLYINLFLFYFNGTIFQKESKIFIF